MTLNETKDIIGLIKRFTAKKNKILVCHQYQVQGPVVGPVMLLSSAPS